ncbi:Shwachman-Bodian-diamond syndrome protein [Aaosphaeria arxii CBS 175.79]|uniref:Shwachman-Bodian-diamond syndrome protein n=1 Tax=Aaosphaeria arxii CBS 175.79 TaxID=1450172 RepID=A0A6A5X7V9_9PLEO|nr:Shwachman-Bodian-diamond syndrome protein [Aaosphaeria arxii CBS 175.79]KAF2008979.1 Shwachman-Bodian-diamond syndrome protein [Aaosphaeria arxii CBS 175.79]
MPINQPSNQIKLTNVALVRLKKGKKRYEIACYKNKLLEYKEKIETDIDNVLQITRVFVNVNKGEYANKGDLEKSFPGKKEEEIIAEILDKGEFQVGEQERHAQIDRVRNEVIHMVAGRLVNPETKRVYTTGMIEKALDQLSSQSSHQKPEKHDGSAEGDAEKEKAEALPQWRGVLPNKPAKTQAQLAMKALIAHQPIPVMKARMRLRVSCPSSILKRAPETGPKEQPAKAPSKGKKGKKGEEPEEAADDKPIRTVKETLLGFFAEVETQEVVGDEWEAVGFVDPGEYNLLRDFIANHTKGRGRAEILDMAVKHEDD